MFEYTFNNDVKILEMFEVDTSKIIIENFETNQYSRCLSKYPNGVLLDVYIYKTTNKIVIKCNKSLTYDGDSKVSINL